MLLLLAACGSAPPMEEPAAPLPDAPASQPQPSEAPSDPPPAEDPAPGQPVETYFEAHNIPVEDGPRDCAMSGVIYHPEAYGQEGMQEAQDFTRTVLGCYTEPAEEGFVTVHYIEEVKMTLKDYDYDGFGMDVMRELTSCWFSSGLYDLYTGIELPMGSLNGDVAGSENITIVEAGGVSYEITSSREQEWSFGPWAIEPNWEYGYSNGACVSHATIKVPAGYDGLVYGCIYRDKVTDGMAGRFDDGNEAALVEPEYAADNENWGKSIYFRINGPATPTIPASDPAGPDPFVEGSNPYESMSGQ